MPVVAASFGDYFPELRSKEAHIMAVLAEEEEAFNSMLVRGIKHLKDLTEGVVKAGAPKQARGQWSPPNAQVTGDVLLLSGYGCRGLFLVRLAWVSARPHGTYGRRAR